MKYFTLLTIILLSVTSFAQEQKQKKPYEQKNDSLLAIFKARRLETEKKQRELYNKLLPLFPDDTGKLILRGAGYTRLPEGINRFSSAKIIDISGNKLKSISKNDLCYDSTEILILTHNNLKKLRFPKENNIKTLIIEANGLKRIPRGVKRLKYLETLNVSHNHIKRIPHFIGSLDSLQEINLNYNRVRLKKSSVRRLSKVRRILLGANNIEKLPLNINLLDSAERLNLGKNRLSSLPPSFARLTGLKSLILYKNDFDSVPKEVFALNNLEELDFYYNHLKQIPPEIGGFRHLKQLYLAFNRIETLPDTMKYLKQLRYLYLHHNNLKMLPVWLLELKHLERAGFDHNRIFSMPDLSLLPHLQEIDLSNNNLEYLPWNLIHKENLRLLILRNNPFIMTKKDKETLDKIKIKREQQGKTLIY